MNQSSPLLFVVAAILAILNCCHGRAEDVPSVRYPSVPLIACDPYFSIWSPADNLTGKDTVHWSGVRHRLMCTVQIDGKAYRLCGREPAHLPALKQIAVVVLPTQTIYRFRDADVEIAMTFTTAALPEDLDIYSRPVTYVDWNIKSADGQTHSVGICFGVHPEVATHLSSQKVTIDTSETPGLVALRTGTVDQPVLQRSGDAVRIDWGYLYLAAGVEASPRVEAVHLSELNPKQEHKSSPSFNGPVSSAPFLTIADEPTAWSADGVLKRTVMLAYDDLCSIEYFGKNLRPYWRRAGMEAAELLQKAWQERDHLLRRCEAFDRELIADAVAIGGPKYAQLCALAYRQCYAAHKLCADDNGQPLLFGKENFSNGCIGTVDVIYPAAPFFFLFGPSLSKALLISNLDYASSPRWKFPFAPHDLGTYPLANGQVYGGGEKTEENQMPVEETGNMLLLVTALARLEGNAEFAKPYRDLLARWGEFLKEKGYDPERQLCTDDFAGHLAHNVNLSAKAICALAAYGQLCGMFGEETRARQYETVAKDFAAKWMKEAKDGDRYRLAFDKPGTWSQKYNLVWDRLLDLKLFPDEVQKTEMAHYRAVQNKYGLPLDSRRKYTKLDWIVWTATLTEKRDDFEALIDPVFEFMNATQPRVPLTDWYATNSAIKVGFQARPVVGGVFLPFLYHESIWRKWASRDRARSASWAPFPIGKSSGTD